MIVRRRGVERGRRRKAGAVAAAAEAAAPTVVVEQTAVDRRDPVVDPGRRTVAGRPGLRKRGDLPAEPPGGIRDEPVDHALGRSRGLTSKLRLGCEQGRKPPARLG